MNQRIYKIAIGYFSLFSVALLLSGIAMFVLKTELNISGILGYYETKSLKGLLELSHPHFAAMGIFIMVLGHFFIFTQTEQNLKHVIIFIFFSALIAITSPFMILYGFSFGAIFKLVAVLSLVILGIFFSLKLYKSI